MQVKVVIKGIVQGVGFRPFVYRTALANGLVGYVRNRGDAGVEIVVEGKRDKIKHFIQDLKRKQPPLSQIYDLVVGDSCSQGEFNKFSIIRSFEGGRMSGSVIPIDVSICDKCISELQDERNRRYEYFFITCTDCGPRYSMIYKIPYDRRNTTLREFPMCKECENEYNNPLNRRFNAQTISCTRCGPNIFLTDNEGKKIEVVDPIQKAGKLTEEGQIIALKGNGGFHIITSTTKSDPIRRLRDTKHRSQKPFATMGRDLETIKSFADVNTVAAKCLTSNIRPIVLLKKRKYYLSELISPGLHNIGVMLPYTGLHYLLFEKVDEPAFVMTSANAPGEPIIIDNKEALTKLGTTVDYFLFHNRKIAQRCDDSLLRIHTNKTNIVRRSRGYAPAPIQLNYSKGRTTLALGAEESVTSCFILGDKAFISQHIGDVKNLETFNFLKDATNHILDITKGKADVIACDLHPKFITTKLAHELGIELGCDVLEVQHHYAHILSLMGERGLDESIGIICDGAGYGSDGNTWGGEILHATLEGFNRLGHLKTQKMIGGDLATKYPLRIAIGVLSEIMDISEWALSLSKHFPYREQEVKIIQKQLEADQVPLTSSCGRILDAIAAILGICYKRSYEGEPAMKLESTALRGEDVLKLKPQIKQGIIDTTYLLHEIFTTKKSYSISDLAYSAETYIGESLAEVAITEAKKMGIETIGFSGGVAYNGHISSTIKKGVEDNKLKFLTHFKVPTGDGGISFGQAIRANRLKERK